MKPLRAFFVITTLFYLSISFSQEQYNEKYQVVKINNLLKEVAKNYNNNVTNLIRVEDGVLFYDVKKPGVYTTTTRVGLNRLDPKFVKVKKGEFLGFKTLKGKWFVSISTFPDNRYKGFLILLENKNQKNKHQQLVILFKELIEKYQ